MLNAADVGRHQHGARHVLQTRQLAVAQLAGQLGLLTFVWVGWVAPGTVNYVGGPVEEVVGTVSTISGTAAA